MLTRISFSKKLKNVLGLQIFFIQSISYHHSKIANGGTMYCE